MNSNGTREAEFRENGENHSLEKGVVKQEKEDNASQSPKEVNQLHAVDQERKKHDSESLYLSFLQQAL